MPAPSLAIRQNVDVWTEMSGAFLSYTMDRAMFGEDVDRSLVFGKVKMSLDAQPLKEVCR